jgi:predicted Zn-dependent protease
MQQVGSPEEARAAEQKWKQCESDLKRVAELGRAISAAPRDPALRTEMGELFLKNGREQDGLRWLESALREQPDYPLAHRLLASYYERMGQEDKAGRHRKFGQPEVRDRE